MASWVAIIININGPTGSLMMPKLCNALPTWVEKDYLYSGNRIKMQYNSRQNQGINWCCAAVLALFAASNCEAQSIEANEKNDITKDGVSKKITSTSKLAQPGRKPAPIALNCSDEAVQLSMTPKDRDNSIERQEIEQILKLSGSNHGLTLFNLAQSDVMWWVRVFGSVSIATLPAALHEAHHSVNFALSNCNMGRYSYLLDSKVYISSLRAGDLPSYSIVNDYLPAQFKTSEIGSRYSQYILKNGKSKNTDYSVLLDELVAYIGGASIERGIVQSPSAAWLIPDGMTRLNGNLGGAVEFMLYTLCYLKAMRIGNPDAYSQIETFSIGLLSKIWGMAENELVSSYRYTEFYQSSNILTVPLAALKAVYSDEFIKELDVLNIKHMTLGSWRESYLKGDVDDIAAVNGVAVN